MQRAGPTWLWLLAVLSVSSPAWAERHVLQVEKFGGPWRRQTNIPGYLGDGFCTSNANPKVATTAMRTTVEIGEGGRYRVWVRAFTSANSRPLVGTARHFGIWRAAGGLWARAGRPTVRS